MLVILPGFVLGHLLALLLAAAAVWRAGSWIDRAIDAVAAVLISLAGATIIIATQYALSSPVGLDWLPVRGWRVEDFVSWVKAVSAPTVAIALKRGLRTNPGTPWRLPHDMPAPHEAHAQLGCS